MNRPEARNAMTGTMTAALADALGGAELDPAVRCIVLTGSGGAFSGGGDVKAMAASGDGTVGDNTIDGAIHRQRINQLPFRILYRLTRKRHFALTGGARPRRHRARVNVFQSDGDV